MKSLLLLCLIALAVSAAVIKMPVHEHKAPREYQRLKKGSQPAIDYIDNFYLADVTVGTPPQTFQVVMSTGSTRFWVVDESCTARACDGTHNQHFQDHKKNKYRRGDSSTYKNNGSRFEYTYGNGRCSGKYVVDTFTIGGLEVKNQMFGAASAVSTTFGEFPIDGILGLGWPTTDDPTPPMQNLLPQLDAPLFTVWLDRHVISSQGQVGGLFTLGAVDTVNCDSSVVYTSVTNKYYWQFKLDSFKVGTYQNARSAQVISNTESSHISAPRKDFDQIVRFWNAEYDQSKRKYLVNCNAAGSLPDLVFRINGQNLAVPAKELVLDHGYDNGKCVLEIRVRETSSYDWDLGAPFIRAFCNIYDFGNSRIGFARAHHKEV